MVFALLFAAIIWNLGTWYLSLPASSSHTLIGSVIGIGAANALMRGQSAFSGVNWSQAIDVGYALLLSPVVGFAAAALLLLATRRIIHTQALYVEPTGRAPPPPWWIRGLLILTCTSVSYAHGSNDGQKGMGLIMLILIVAAVAYAPNHVLPPVQFSEFQDASKKAAEVIQKPDDGDNLQIRDPRSLIRSYVTERQKQQNASEHQIAEGTHLALADLIKQISSPPANDCGDQAGAATPVANTREDMYLVSQAIDFLVEDKKSGLSHLPRDDVDTLDRYRQSLNGAFILRWVRIAVALALGLGTMMGWKRIVITVGERIGKTHLTYAQGASAEVVAAATILAADFASLPVSTTHVLSSGIAGTMAASGSGLQWVTIRNIIAGWVLTLPAAIALSATLYWIFSQVFRAVSQVFRAFHGI
jgi:PiT family inorganic phosphate transporter